MYWLPTVRSVDKALKLTTVGLVAESSVSGIPRLWKFVMVVAPVDVSVRVQLRGQLLVIGSMAMEVPT